MHLPEALAPANEATALAYLRTYYGITGTGYSGRWFDGWDSTGTSTADRDTITSDDLIAITLLSVTVPGPAAARILRDDREQISDLLRAIDDVDLVGVDPADIVPEWPAWQLWTLLSRGTDGVGPTITSKLLARKRPRLMPIADRVVLDLTQGRSSFWASLCTALREDDQALHKHLLHLRAEADLPDSLSPLRVFDVVAWMEGKATERDDDLAGQERQDQVAQRETP